ncbi:Gfo/Idh/MocA family protein [Halosimplex pelagicum]|uniref:Gfo/Idh/MocA family oxidoreductase n=1 Tax=Halosimplex pelagicum TaxID=869886 RepID=A0A7D5PAP6_9EURY|nr:Gfo/Idh/MocA family oxidoreductase [Halosimplex pelagicum]QLH83521.1 Gfo/Idh/MocA family oxidoreductase [Halosimplex pelagicum]
MDPLSVGLVGCGNISSRYLSADAVHDAFELVACADLDAELARETAAEHGIEAMAVDELLDDDAVEAVVNLTPPSAHAQVITDALDAGNHVYTEKPFATTPGEVAEIRERAAESDLLVGSAPDTVLGAGLQTARQVLDDGRIGEPVGATAHWTSPGHELWHPNPDLYYQEGGGPLFDMGPYYLTALVFLLGSAERVAGSVSRPHETRTIGSDSRKGEEIDVEVPTHEAGIVDFAGGATANLLMSFDVEASTFPSPAFEVYGTEGTLALPDPNHFEGPVRVRDHADDDWETVPLTHEYTAGRGAGVADLAFAVRGDWEHRTGGALAGHVLDVMAAVRSSSEESAFATIDSDPGRPAPLPADFPDVDP